MLKLHSLLMVFVLAVFVFMPQMLFAKDCWYQAYESAFCETLVRSGVAGGGCLSINQTCWDNEYDYTKKGHKQGTKDAREKIKDALNGIPMR